MVGWYQIKYCMRNGGSGWGTLVNPWLIHVNVWQKTLQYCKVISLQLIKIIRERKKKEMPDKLQNFNLMSDLLLFLLCFSDEHYINLMLAIKYFA